MTTAKLWRNRKERKDWARRLRSEDPGLEVVHPHAAGVDVGNSAHYVAVRPDRDSQPVRRFECFTADLHRLADWLESCRVKTVALQSTGVYWIVLQQEVDMYDVYQKRIAECDQELQKHLARFADTVPSQAKGEETKKKKGKQNKNNPQFHLADELQRITGVDLTRIDSIDIMVAQALISEVGLNMSRWKTEAHFASWLGSAQTIVSAETRCSVAVH